MTSSDRLARAIADSLARHQSRGLVDDATGLADVVIHGRVNLLEVAKDALAASAEELKPAGKSWAAWFVRGVHMRRSARRLAHERERLAERLAREAPADAAIARLKLRDLSS